jgi:ATP-binding cassette subfamily B protein
VSAGVMRQGKNDLYSLTWPASRLGEAMEVTARKHNFLPRLAEAPAPLDTLEHADDAMLGRWLDVTAGRLGLEVEPVESPYAEVDQLVRGVGPALLRLPGRNGGEDEGARFLAILKGGNRITVAAPDLSVRRLRPDAVREALCAALEAPLVEPLERLLAEAGVPPHRRARARRAILREQLNQARIGGCWQVRLSPGATMWDHLRHASLRRPLLALFGGEIIQQALRIVAWWIIGWGALRGRFEWAWLLAWALILFSTIPFRLLMLWGQKLVAISVGGLFKQRLLYGTLQLEPEEIRHQGAGQFLGRVIESEAVELLALGGGFMAVMALIELAMAAGILAMGAGGWLHAVLLLGWAASTLLLGWRYFRHSHTWIDVYRAMTNDLVERMVGHRTRLAQEDSQHWHEDEDRNLDHYLKLSERLDNSGIQISALMPRGWLILGLSGVAYTFVVAPTSPAALAISLGGILMAFQALTSLVAGIMSVIGAALAWGQVAPLFRAAARPKDGQAQAAELSVEPDHAQSLGPNSSESGQPVLVARDLVFRYREHGQPVLQGCSLRIRQGDRMLLEGPSGGGKSTLAALLAGLRLPESGLLMLWGFDRQSLGTAEWRRRVVVAPQFHENHVLTETLAFNLLMGRRWPPFAEDLDEAEAICRELGLGDVLDRMPSGFQQMVGESGWQLSHGERSRLYIARALLQKADLIILDESFAALDPENLRRALQCTLNRASTLLVIAHP